MCVYCLKEWAKRNLPRVIPTAEAIEQHQPLVKTVKVTKVRPSAEISTVVIRHKK